jgi:hypothetical protein
MMISIDENFQNLSPFVHKYFNKNRHTIEYFAEQMFEVEDLTASDRYRSLPKLIQDLSFVLAFRKLDDVSFQVPYKIKLN